MKGFFGEFKKFISRGNVFDMAVGIVVGGAFSNIVSSFVADIITPVISLLTGNVSFSELKVVLREAVEATETTEAVSEIAITYGNLIQVVINFIIIAFVLFCFVRSINKLKELSEKDEKEAAAKAAAEKAAADAEAAAAAAAEAERIAAIPTKEEVLLAEIRDLLKSKK